MEGGTNPKVDWTQYLENHQLSKSQKMNNQQEAVAGAANNPTNHSRKIQFDILLSMIMPHIDKDRAMQLQTLHSKLKSFELPNDNFLRLVRNLVGDQMLRQAFNKYQLEQTKAQVARSSQTRPSQFQVDAPFPTLENDAQNSRGTDNQLDLRGMHISQTVSSSMSTVIEEAELLTIPLRGLTKQQQQHVHLPRTPSPTYGTTTSNYHSHEYSGTAVGGSTTPIKSQSQDSQMRQILLHQGMASTQSGSAPLPVNLMIVPKHDMQNSMNETKILCSGSHPHLTNHSTSQHMAVPCQSSVNKEQKSSVMSSISYVNQEVNDKTPEQQQQFQLSVSMGSSCSSIEQVELGNMAPSGMNSVSGLMVAQLDPMALMQALVPSATTSLVTGTNMRTPQKKPSVGQKKPFSALGVPSPVASKKQKVTGSFLEQSIEQLNDVTAVSGVNLREEEEQLLSVPMKENQASEATRRIMLEEEENLILQNNVLQKKLAKIMLNCGIKNVGNDVERCLSLCVEERMRGLISDLIRLSKQRIDVERLRHSVLITSDVRRQILMMNWKAKEGWEKKQAEEAEKSQKLDEVNKDEDDRMRTAAANIAARVAVGGDNMQSKWQLMAERARQNCGGGSDMSPLGKAASCKPLSTSEKDLRDNQDTESRGPSVAAAVSGPSRKLGKNQVVAPPAKITHAVSVKDLIAALEREPQMSKSTMLYCLYERMHTNATTE